MTPRAVDAGVGIGELFLDKYRVDSILGHGGMGVVALCTHLQLNERVAIKMLRKDVLDDEAAVERFMREAQAAVKLKSEFVARVSDVGRSESNVPYMVMEYLEGHDLGQLLDERGSFSLQWAVEITLQACEALAEAHSIGIVHRDIKPTNLFVTWRPDGSALIKVLDFGISKAPIASSMQLTQTQSLLGTPAYMSPEQTRSARMVDSRTDIWALGTVLYELLEGCRPFEAESFSEMCVKVAIDPPRPMTNTPAALQVVVLRCLEKAADDRYASMAELARDLVQFAQDPHSAQVLVERMSRMLRRSAVIDWDPANSGPLRVSGPRTAEVPPLSGPIVIPPQLLPPGMSGPLAAMRVSMPLPAQVQTPPAGAPVVESAPAPGVSALVVPNAGDGTVSPGALADAAQVRKRPPTRSVTLAVPGRRKRRRTVVIVALLASAAAIGVVVSLLRSQPDAVPALPAPEIVQKQPAPPPPDKLAPVPVPPVDRRTDDPPAELAHESPVAHVTTERPAPNKPTPTSKLKPPAPVIAPDAPAFDRKLCDPNDPHAPPHPPPECFKHPQEP